MQHERGIIFGPLGIVGSDVANALALNNDGDTPSWWVSSEIG